MKILGSLSLKMLLIFKELQKNYWTRGIIYFLYLHMQPGSKGMSYLIENQNQDLPPTFGGLPLIQYDHKAS